MKQSRMHWRGLVPLLAGILATALVATGGVPTNASPLTANSSAQAVERPVLSSDYGKAVSRVEGTFGKAGTVTGTFTPRRFKVSPAGKLKAVGKLTATLTKGNGTVVGTDSQKVAIPVQSIEGQGLPTAATALAATGCDVLNLVLGPLDLDVLGLQVHLDKVVLDITAVPGAGNLLGNLLCAVAGLLDNTGVLTQIKQILNSILAILRL